VKYLYLTIVLLCNSCGYPDIDSVPDFKDVKLTKDELIDLCTNETSDKNNNILCEDLNE
tara:strand:+ start:495 stop:671 length:177 start_codon:yes stop_codon:yes gene_type:complete